MDKDLRDKVVRRWTGLKLAREPYVDQWRAISQHITPASGRFLTSESDSPTISRDRWNRIYDNTATRAANILAAGLMSGMTDPSSQWFALTTGSPNLDESHSTKVYLDQVQRIMEMLFNRTNVYQALHHCWREVGVYGTSAMFVMEDPVYGLHCYPLCCGEYCLASSFRGTPNTIYRRITMTAAQLVERYGRNKVGRGVLLNYDSARYDKTYRVLHAVEPRFERDPSKPDARNMPWRSLEILLDSDTDSDGILKESGFNEFPAVVGRWGAAATDTYSEESPGMVALGDTKQLQHDTMQMGNAVDYQVDPPLVLPTSARDAEVDFEPGGRSYVDTPTAGQQVHSAYQVQIDTRGLQQNMLAEQQRIKEAFSVDMFLMLSGGTANMTATEVAERHEEKLMMLGPVLSRLNNEILKPLIERTFNILARANQLPPTPEELAGQELTVEYTSMLARSQRAIRANSLDQFLSRLVQMAQYKPEVIAKINGYQAVDEYADYYSVAPGVVVPTEEAMAFIQQQQQAQQQQAQAAQLQQSADALARLGKVPADGSTVGGQIVQGMQQAADSQAQPAPQQ